MPIFEYNCESCDTPFELLVRGDEKPKCPKCGSAKLNKMFSVPSAHSGSSDLPISGGTCGRPQCGTGGCQGLG